MSNDSKKLLTLGNVEAIKDYIDVSSNNIKYYVDEEFKDAVNTKIEQAKGELNNSFIAKTTEITNKITLLEQTTGNKNEINELRLQLDAVKADNDAMNTALEALSAELEAGLNGVSGSIMSAGQINELVNTALINSVNISSDAVEAPTVYTQNLVALIGKFGQIKATNITGSEISGKTVKSTSGSWELNNNGAGKLANGNITWNENGNVTFGPGVKLNWDNIEGSDDATSGVEAAMSTATAAAAAAAAAQASANEATALANEAKNSIPTAEDIEDKITTEINKYEVKAEQLTGKTITGATIKSTDDKWELTSTGAGKLANGNITWTDDGVVTLSDNVELKWGNITGAPTIPEDGITEAQVNDLIATQITNSGITANTIEGKTVKSTDDKWELNSDGSGYLGKFENTKSIEWGTDTNDNEYVKIQGTNVEISGDVKINGAAIITGITSNASAQESFNTMVANCIDATEIKTDVLETKPDDTDKVHIEDNYIHCITNTGDKSLIISSNDVDPGELDTLFNPNAVINDNVVTDISFDATTTYHDATYACNSSIWRSSDSVTNKNLIVNYGYTENGDPINIATSGSKVGYIYKNGKINANISLVLYKGHNTTFNPLTANAVSLTNWAIAEQSPITNGWGITNNGIIIFPSESPLLPTTYIVGGDDTFPGTTSYTIGRILVYRADTNNGVYYKYVEREISGTANWNESIIGCTRTLTINDIEISDPGYYAVELCFNPNSFILLTSTTATSENYCMHGGITTYIEQDTPADYMKIGKNGLVAFNGNTGFSINDNNITMRARSGNNFYGLKISNSGIHISDGSTYWKPLNATKLLSLVESADKLLSLVESN